MRTKSLAPATALAVGLATVAVVGGSLSPASAWQDTSSEVTGSSSSSGSGAGSGSGSGSASGHGGSGSSGSGSSSGTGSGGSSSGSGHGPQGDTVGSTDWGDVAPGEAADAQGAHGWAAGRDSGSLFSLEARQGIHEAWADGATGKNITVAVIDTGIAPVDGVDRLGKQLVNGPDLSFDPQVGLPAYVDAFGHGTHLAGIIAGRDDDWDRKQPDPSQFAGVAPEAQLLNVKVGASDGGADVSQVIAALDWVTQHRKDNNLNVRVISLAYGTESVQPWQVDPLAHAVESAWEAGIVVVAAAGNDGLAAPSLLMPALDPRIIAVGASDQLGTDTLADDVVADFSNGGSAVRRPDVVAPGRSLVSLRVPGSYVDTLHSEGRVQGDESGRFFRGSGTSQATAFVAGEVALLLDQRPQLTPDQVKAILVGTARPLASGQVEQGAGMTDLGAALAAPAPRPQDLPTYAPATGSGSLELARGGAHVVDPDTGVALTGEKDILGGTWDPLAWAAASSAGTSWTAGAWNGHTWTGDHFKRSVWAFVPWTDPSWTGAPWASYRQGDTQWVARSWRTDSWEARSWRAELWRARSWRSTT